MTPERKRSHSSQALAIASELALQRRKNEETNCLGAVANTCTPVRSHDRAFCDGGSGEEEVTSLITMRGRFRALKK